MREQNKTESHVVGKLAAGVAVGAPAGAFVAMASVGKYVHDNARTKGWLDEILDKRAEVVRNATNDQINDLIDSRVHVDPEIGYTNPKWLKNAEQEYNQGAKAILENKGIKSWGGYFKSLNGNQVAKTLAFAGAAAVGVGALGYAIAGALLNTKSENDRTHR